MKRKSLALTAFILLFILLCACNRDQTPNDSTEQIPYDREQEVSTNEKRFDKLLDELFADWVSEDTLTMQFYLADPEAMGIKRLKPTYGEVTSPQLLEKEREDTKYVKETLDNISYSMLSSDRQVIYDILTRAIELSQILEENDDYSYYTGYIRPVTGIQVQLPVLLAEFKFYTADDIEIYLQLLEDTIRYFDDIIEFERERAARGFFLRDVNLDTVIEQLEAFTASREDCFIITVVNDKIDQYPGLTDEQRDEYKSRNTDLVLNNVLIAYDNLLEAMYELKNEGGGVTGGLASLPDGDKVALAMMSLRAGTDRTAEEIDSLLYMWAMQTQYSVYTLLFGDQDLMSKYENDELGIIPDGTPEEYMKILEAAMQNDFPPIDSAEYSIYEVHESLSEFISPAFFLTPAIDRFDDNIIYINPSKLGDNLRFFTVLAHEGYPGHMYEAVYNRQAGFHPIRAMLDNTGYSEGWATYTEYISFNYAGLSENEALFLSQMDLYNMLVQTRIDVGVNMLNWSFDDVVTMLEEDFGISDKNTATLIYDHVTGLPLNSSMYTLGYIEFCLLREDYESIKGDSFDQREFHKFILDFGPAPFEIIRNNFS